MRNRGLFEVKEHLDKKYGARIVVPEDEDKDGYRIVDVDNTEWAKNILTNRCLRCGKRLKNPNSQRIGYGPYCDKKRLNDCGKIYRGRRLF